MNKVKKHRISGGFNPTEYTYCESFDYRLDEYTDHAHGGGWGEPHDPLDEYYQEKLKENGYDHAHCTHCGSVLKRGHVYLHEPSGEHIVMGVTCQERLGFSSADEIKKAHRENRLRLARLRNLMKHSWRWKIVGEFLIENEDKHEIIGDMINKLNKYFKLSRRQIAFARSLVRKADNYEKIKAEREAKKAKAPDWTEGRFPIEGKAVSFKDVDSAYGWTIKVLIELPDGRRCWGTMPRGYEGDKGDPIALTATFSVSKDDSKFAFFSRPKINSKKVEICA